MPAFVKTPEDERLWAKAKGLAEDQGHKEDWAYITGIFKKMKGGKVAAEFINPFSGLVPRKMTDRELSRALRLAQAAELEAVHLYEAHADATDNPLVKEVLQDIANEERVHVGELQHLLELLLPDEKKYLEEGAGEVDDKVKEQTKAASFSRVAAQYVRRVAK